MLLTNLFFLKLQISLREIEPFLKNASSREQKVIRKYVLRHQYLYTFICISFVTTAVLFIFVPYFTDNNLPADAWYPFATDAPSVRILLYILQSVVIFEVGLCILIDFSIAMLLWFSTTRLELLGQEFERVRNSKDISLCIRKHQDLAL